MPENEQETCMPPDAEWVELSPDLLSSPEGEKWQERAERFTPFQDDPSKEMARTLRAGIGKREIDAKTRAIHNDALLGFYSVEKVMTQISNLSDRLVGVAETLGMNKRETGLLLSAIVRSDETEGGFGQLLVEDVIGYAMDDRDVKAILVLPANQRLRELWLDVYHFEPVASGEDPNLLYMPVNVGPGDQVPLET